MNKQQRINILNNKNALPQKKQAQTTSTINEESTTTDLIFDKLWNEALNEEIEKLPNVV